jgi:hypothetical protein
MAIRGAGAAERSAKASLTARLLVRHSGLAGQMMTDIRWETFEGTHFEVGRKLGRYWVQRLEACEKSKYGRGFLKKKPYRKWLGDYQWSENHERLVGTFRRHFPLLVEEINGMVQGANDAGYKASFKTMFRMSLGEVDDDEVLDCSTIAHHGDKEMTLAHNEEDDCRYPLCYATVRLYKKSGNRDFLTVSYPFQFFGSAVGANSTLAFTGNSIGMSKLRKREVRHSLDGRVAKTVFSRLMLEEPSPSEIKRLLRSYHAVSPCHWYIASRASIISAKIRPRASAEGDAADQLRAPDIPQETSYHTNHFQQGDSACWSWPKYKDQEESKERLATLRSFAESIGADRYVTMSSLREPLERLRVCTRKRYTSATILLAVAQSGTKVQAFDHFDGDTVPVGTRAISA